ncbi:quinoprotein relay system zinc metallohydrolase 1 [Sphingomonas oryzagri]
MMLSRRLMLAGMLGAAALPAAAAPLAYAIVPEPIGEGLWLVRGADAPIEMANGGAIANITIAATDAGAVLVDCGPSLRYGEALRAVAEKLVGKPVVRVYLTHLHPDHVYGAAAFDPLAVAATPQLVDILKRDGAGFSDGMYRLLGDWMRGTELRIPGTVLASDHETIGGRDFGLIALSGHSAADLAVLDRRTGTLIAGDLVFHDRAPSTPHADLPAWRASLDRLKALPHRATVPGHGPFDPTPAAAIDQTRDWIDWLDRTLRDAVAEGLDMAEAGNLPIPPRFAHVAAARYELERSVSHFYPGLEADLLPRIDTAR